MLTNFENEIDSVFNETLVDLQLKQREATNLLNAPIEKLKIMLEDMAHRRVESVYLKIENEIMAFREILEQIRAFIVDEEGFIPFNYSQEDLDAIASLKTTASIMIEGLLDDITKIILHFSESLMEPI